MRQCSISYISTLQQTPLDRHPLFFRPEKLFPLSHGNIFLMCAVNDIGSVLITVPDLQQELADTFTFRSRGIKNGCSTSGDNRFLNQTSVCKIL